MQSLGCRVFGVQPTCCTPVRVKNVYADFNKLDYGFKIKFIMLKGWPNLLSRLEIEVEVGKSRILALEVAHG